MNTITYLTKRYRIPFFTWSHIIQSNAIEIDKKFIKRIKRDENSQRIAFIDLVKNQTPEYEIKENEYPTYVLTDQIRSEGSDVQFHLRPDLSLIILKLIQYHKWSEFFYIYNHEKGNKYLIC